jgi:homoserine/homoserine lactone efflux protein
MSLEAWVAFCLTETILCFVPGPAVLTVVSVAIARGMGPGLRASLGILAANAAYFALSAAGVGTALVASYELFLAVKWLGAAYLVWLGLGMLFARQPPAEGIAASAPLEAVAPDRAFARGLLVQGANPKAIVFFTALLPQFIDPRGSVALQVAILGASSVLIELAVLAVYATAAVRARRWAGARLRGPFERAGGLLLVAAGARLAAVRSP